MRNNLEDKVGGREASRCVHKWDVPSQKRTVYIATVVERERRQVFF